MKNIFLLVATLTFIACKKEATVDYAIISGKIKNKPLGEITINSMDRSYTEVLKIYEDGSFIDTLTTDITSFVLYDGENPVFLNIEPGNDLNINYDAQDFSNSLSITGKGSEVSNYLLAKRKNEQNMFGNSAETYSLNEFEFKTKFKDIKKANEDLLTNTKGLTDEFIAREKRDLRYFYIMRLLDYESAHKHFTKKQDFKVSDDFLSEYAGFDFSNAEDFKSSNNYKGIVTNHYSNKAKELSKKEAITNDLAFVKIVSAIENESIRNGLLFDFANYNMGYSKNIEGFFEAFLATSSNKNNNELITEKYNKLTAVAKGKASPKFIDYENFAGGTTSLDDLKGKYVYIDVWATWCGPCKREIPFLKDIEKKYHNKNIEFVSLSIDKVSDRDKWKSMVTDEELGGIQLFADNDWKSSFVKDYQINGIPRFILIDTEGNIVDPNAPRPSSPELIELLTELNI